MVRLMRLLIPVLLLSLSFAPVHAQTEQAIPLRVEAPVTGQLSTAAPTVTYSFNAIESLRMGFVFDVVGDMDVTLVVLDQDGVTVLAGSTGKNNNGVVVKFPAEGQYYVALSASTGTSATYRLMIDADPALPTNAFVAQTYLVEGASSTCEETIPTTYFSPTEDMNVCFVLDLVDESMELTAVWWSPNGEIVSEESATVDSTANLVPYLTGLIYDGTTPFSEGFWQVHFMLNGELAHIQWVSVITK